MSDRMKQYVEDNSYQIPDEGEFTECAPPEEDADDQNEGGGDKKAPGVEPA